VTPAGHEIATGEGSTNADVSVVVCAYTLDRWEWLTAALRSAVEQTPPPREVVLVIDHNPELLARARASLPAVVVIENGGERGLSGGRNSGLAIARGEVVAFLDDDAEAEPGWLAALTAPYADRTVVATGGRILPAWVVRRPAWMPEEFDWVVGCTYRGLPTSSAEIRNPIGASMSIRRTSALEAGGFRTEVGRVGTLPAGDEETDISIRMKAGHPEARIIYAPDSVVRHHVPAARARWAYFRSRCYQEGRSKAILARLEGATAALSSERSYTMRVLPMGVLRGMGSALRGDPWGIGRAAAIVLGLLLTTTGYVVGRMRPGPRRPSPAG
jgi:glucosyl-dolichyl phosphate glucuronosyltransferase